MYNNLSKEELIDLINGYKTLSQELSILLIEMFISFRTTEELAEFKNKHVNIINNINNKLNNLNNEA